MTPSTKRCSSIFDLLPWQRNLGYFLSNFILNWFFFFVSRQNRAIFWPLVLHDPLYKTLLGPNTQNLLLKICTKSPISRLVWQIDRGCLRLPGGFRDGPFNGTMQNVVGPTLVAMATKFGLGADIQSPTGLLVCLSVCLSDIWKSCERILTKFLGEMGHGPGTNEFNFGDDPNHHPDPGVRSPKIRIHWITEKVTNEFWWNFMESWGVA